MANDVFNIAKAAAYSGMLMLFPALLVVTTLLAQVPEGTTLVGKFAAPSSRFCPATRWTCCSPTCSAAAFTPRR
jgi:membrane protein